MTIFKTAILPYKYFFTDLKNNLSTKVLIWTILYVLLSLYIKQVIERVVGSGNQDSSTWLLIVSYIQQLLTAFSLAFCLRQTYITTLNSEPFISKFGINPDIGQNSNRTFRLFIVYTFIIYILSTLSGLSNYYFSWLIFAPILFPGYFVIFPAFALLKNPQTTYRQSVMLINKELCGKKIRLSLITLITAAIFWFVQTILGSILVGFIAYKIVTGNGNDATVGSMV
jgi:hypothetical protein